jgi:hypothetical protein
MTITNGFGAKNLRERFPAIVNVQSPTPDRLASEIETVVARVDLRIGEFCDRRVSNNKLSLVQKSTQEQLIQLIKLEGIKGTSH